MKSPSHLHYTAEHLWVEKTDDDIKTGSDLHAPMDGVVTAVNEDLINSPEEINDNPYQSWIFKFTPADVNDTSHLLSADAYTALVD